MHHALKSHDQYPLLLHSHKSCHGSIGSLRQARAISDVSRAWSHCPSGTLPWQYIRSSRRGGFSRTLSVPPFLTGPGQDFRPPLIALMELGLIPRKSDLRCVPSVVSLPSGTLPWQYIRSSRRGGLLSHPLCASIPHRAGSRLPPASHSADGAWSHSTQERSPMCPERGLTAIWNYHGSTSDPHAGEAFSRTLSVPPFLTGPGQDFRPPLIALMELGLIPLHVCYLPQCAAHHVSGCGKPLSITRKSHKRPRLHATLLLRSSSIRQQRCIIMRHLAISAKLQAHPHGASHLSDKRAHAHASSSPTNSQASLLAVQWL